MRHRILIAALLLLFPLSLFAVDTASDALTIRAYKVAIPKDGDEHVEMRVFDAITDSLKEISEGGTVDLSRYVSGSIDGNSLIGDASSAKTGRLIYAFNVEGNTMGSYGVTIEMNPFVLMNGETEVKSDTINYYFHTMNDFAYFKGSESLTSMDGAKFLYVSTTVGSKADASYNKISIPFSIYGLTKPTTDVWTIRCGIGLVIDQSEYTKAPNGRYRATAKITLTEYT